MRARPCATQTGSEPISRAGLRIESLEEHPGLAWSADFLVEREPGGPYVLPSGAGELPLMFSLNAMKPATG